MALWVSPARNVERNKPPFAVPPWKVAPLTALVLLRRGRKRHHFPGRADNVWVRRRDPARRSTHTRPGACLKPRAHHSSGSYAVPRGHRIVALIWLCAQSCAWPSRRRPPAAARCLRTCLAHAGRLSPGRRQIQPWFYISFLFYVGWGGERLPQGQR